MTTQPAVVDEDLLSMLHGLCSGTLPSYHQYFEGGNGLFEIATTLWRLQDRRLTGFRHDYHHLNIPGLGTIRWSCSRHYPGGAWDLRNRYFLLHLETWPILRWCGRSWMKGTPSKTEWFKGKGGLRSKIEELLGGIESARLGCHQPFKPDWSVVVSSDCKHRTISPSIPLTRR